MNQKTLADELVGWLASDPGLSRADLIDRVRRSRPLVDGAEVVRAVDRACERAAGLGAIADLFDDPEVTEIMINGPGRVWVDRDGDLQATNTTLDGTEIDVLASRILEPLSLRVDRTSPIVDARLPDGSRVSIVVPPVAVDGTTITIRRFRQAGVELDAFGPDDCGEVLAELVRARQTVLVVGGTGAGKTTLLNALGACLPQRERIVVVEDTAELQLPGDHVVRLEARHANSEGVGEVSLRQLVRAALRMRPDRIVVGEVRGGEAIDLLMALNTGHDGSLATCHANSPMAGLRRLEVLALLGGVDVPVAAVREQIVEAFDAIVHVARRTDGSRAVTQIAGISASGLQTEWRAS